MTEKTKEQLRNEKWEKYLAAKFPELTVEQVKAMRKTVAWKTFIVDSSEVAETVANHANTPNLPYDFYELKIVVDGVEKFFTVAEFKSKLGF